MPAPKRRATIRVVVIEDHQMVAEALAETLPTLDAIEVVGTATTLAEALQLLRRDCPDVALMDVKLPDGDGASGTADVLVACPDAKVLVTSAEVGVDVIARAVTAGAAGFLPKSSRLEELAAAIQQVHAGASVFSPEMLRAVAAHLRRAERRPGADLTEREREILQLLAEARSSEEMAEELVLSQHTVRNHIRNILTKLGAHSQLEAVVIAVREGLVDIAAR